MPSFRSRLRAVVQRPDELTLKLADESTADDDDSDE